MTPPITKSLMASRPLYDPRPETFVAGDIVQQRDLRRVRLSDFVVVALQLNIQNGHIRKGDVDMFENVYVRGAKPRSTRVHEGQASIAPDGTVMSMNGVPYPGSSQKPAGKWTVENVKDCPGYKDWLSRLVQTEDEMVARGFQANRKNEPMPSRAELAVANAYSHSLATRNENTSQRSSSRKVESMENEGVVQKDESDITYNEVINIAARLIDSTIDTVVSFTDHVQSRVDNPVTQQELYKIMHSKIANAFLDEESDEINLESTPRGAAAGTRGNGTELCRPDMGGNAKESVLSDDMEDVLETWTSCPATPGKVRFSQSLEQARWAGKKRLQQQSVVGSANEAKRQKFGPGTSVVAAGAGRGKAEVVGGKPVEGNGGDSDQSKEEAVEDSNEEETEASDSGEDRVEEDFDNEEWERGIKEALDLLTRLPPATAEEEARALLAHNTMSGGSPIDALLAGKNPFRRPTERGPSARHFDTT